MVGATCKCLYHLFPLCDPFSHIIFLLHIWPKTGHNLPMTGLHMKTMGSNFYFIFFQETYSIIDQVAFGQKTSTIYMYIQTHTHKHSLSSKV